MCGNIKTIQQTLSELLSGRLTYHLPSIKVNNGLIIEGKKLDPRLQPQKAHLHPLRDVCMQYENNPANGFWDIVRKLNLKGHAQAKIIKKSVILFWLLNMTKWCKHVHRLELQKFVNFCAAHSPVGLDIETNSRFTIINNHVKNKKYVNFVSISSLTGESTPPDSCVCAIWKQPSKRFARYRPET